MGEPRRLHPAAIAVYSTDALKNLAVPLLVIVGASLLGGRLDTRGLTHAALYGGIGLAIALAAGGLRWATTRYRVADGVIDHRTGILRVQETHVPIARVEALDAHQGPIQRLFGVQALEVQTGAAGKGGEISLPALAAADVRALREATGPARAAAPAAGPRRRLAGRDLLVAALTAGQMGIIVPVLAGAGQLVQQLAGSRGGEREALSLLPGSALGWILAAAGLLAVAWLLSTLGALVAFAGFTVARDGDRLRIRRGLVQRSDATVTVARVRAVRIVEGVFRAPFGLAALHVEVTGYADEPSVARTLFPLVRLRDVRALLDELLPELADDPHGLAPPPRRARRRYLLAPTLAGLALGAAAWAVAGIPYPLLAGALGLGYGWSRWSAAAWRLQHGRLAVRRRVLARTTVLAPAGNRESHTVAQSLLQRRAALADLDVAFGKGTHARIRHLDAADAHAAWQALA